MAVRTLVHPSTALRKSAAPKRVLRLTRSQYREFAEQTKAVGLGLNVSTYKRMGCWGAYSPWALSVVSDASIDKPKFDERALITIASSINMDVLRAAGASRPELDWAVLQDHEIYPFLVQHEIGHRQDNFDVIDNAFVRQDIDTDKRNELHRCIKLGNEVLADRYAWHQIRPGEPVPLSTSGKRMQKKVAEVMAHLEQHCKKMTPCRPDRKMQPGPYLDVPDYMLATPDRAAFVGPKVSRLLLEKRAAYYMDYSTRLPNRPLF